MKCPFCDTELTAGTTVCPDCGTVIEQNEVVAKGKDPGKTLGLVAMIVAIASAVLGLFSCCCCGGVLGVALFFVVSVVSLILGIVASKKSKKAGFKNVFAIVSIIVSAITVGVLGLLLIAMVAYLVIVIATYGLSGIFLMFEGLM